MQLWLHLFHQSMYTRVLFFLLMCREYVPSSNVLAANIISNADLENQIMFFFHSLVSYSPIMTFTQHALGFFFFASW